MQELTFYSKRFEEECEIWHAFALTRDLKPRSTREIPGTNDLEILLGQTREIFQWIASDSETEVSKLLMDVLGREVF